jgi:hypothetical protein
MYIVAWTVRREFANRDEYEDHYVVYSSLEHAQKSFRLLLEEDLVWCVALTKVVDATEPHWLEDVSDGPTDTPKENV